MATIKGDTITLFGTTGLYATGRVTRGTIRTVAAKLELPGNDGDTNTVIYHDERKEADLEFVCDAATPAPAIGDSVTIATESGFLVDESALMWEERGAKKFSMKATKHMTMVLA